MDKIMYDGRTYCDASTWSAAPPVTYILFTLLKLDTPLIYILAVNVDGPVTDSPATEVTPVTLSAPPIPTLLIAVNDDAVTPLVNVADAAFMMPKLFIFSVVVATWLPRSSPIADIGAHFNDAPGPCDVNTWLRGPPVT